MELPVCRARILFRRAIELIFVVAFIFILCFINDYLKPQPLFRNYQESNTSLYISTTNSSNTNFEIVDYYYAQTKNNTLLPVCGRPNFSGKTLLVINTTIPSLEELDAQFQHITLGGHWKPNNCQQRQRIGVIIPFRNRWHHLSILVRHLHELLVRQKRHYTIYVIEQTGQLINVGVLEALKREPDLNCLILHDVDTLPENVFTAYKCNEDHRLVTQMATYQKKRNYKAAYRRYTGGVLSIWRRQFEEINGFSNEFWGWGGEDDDLANRIVHKGYDVARDFSRTGCFYSLEHPYTNANPEREYIVKRHLKRLYVEGLNTTKSALMNVTTHRTFTLFSVDLSLS